MLAPEFRKVFRQYERNLDRELRRDRRRLFEALQEFANIPYDTSKQLLIHFRLRWPDFFPEREYDAAANDSSLSVLSYPYWLHQIWIGGETVPHLEIMLGLRRAPVEGTPEDAWVSDMSSIPPEFYVDWDEGFFRYRGGCDFQRALYLLLRESWRARICGNCSTKFIAKRTAQKYCDRDCSAMIQQKLKREWWAEHGKKWRQHQASKSKRKGKPNVPHKTR
jgi:hypothetical protein